MTKKVKSAGRFGSRYGVGIRKKLLKVETEQKKKHLCPFCGLGRVRRQSAGVFYCRKCNASFAGGAYLPETMTGAIVKKMVSQKSFLPSMAELVAATEKTKLGENIPEELEASSKEKEEKQVFIEEKHQKKEHKKEKQEKEKKSD